MRDHFILPQLTPSAVTPLEYLDDMFDRQPRLPVTTNSRAAIAIVHVRPNVSAMSASVGHNSLLVEIVVDNTHGERATGVTNVDLRFEAIDEADDDVVEFAVGESPHSCVTAK